MAECFKCKISDKKTTLLTAVSKTGIVKVCSRCASSENMPVLTKKEFPASNFVEDPSDKHEKGKMVYNRLSKIAGIKPRDQVLREKEELMRKQDTELRRLVEKGIQEKEEVAERRDDLVANFNWVIMRARRFKHLTQKELAKEIGEPEILVKLAEEGKISTKNERFVDKLESYLNIKLKKSQTESLLGNLNDGDFSFDPVSNKKTTISDLKKMGEAQSKKEEVSQIKEEKRGFFSRKDNSSLIKKEEPNKPLIKEVKPIERKDDFLQLKKEEISRPIIKEIKPMERREIPSNRVGGMIPSLRNIANNPVPKTSVVQTPSKKEELTENKKPLKEDDDKPLTQEDIDRILYGRDFD